MGIFLTGDRDKSSNVKGNMETFVQAIATEPNRLAMMTWLIFAHLLLLGLRATDTTSDTWRRCTGIVPFEYISPVLTTAHFNRSDVQLMIILWMVYGFI